MVSLFNRHDLKKNLMLFFNQNETFVTFLWDSLGGMGGGPIFGGSNSSSECVASIVCESSCALRAGV